MTRQSSGRSWWEKVRRQQRPPQAVLGSRQRGPYASLLVRHHHFARFTALGGPDPPEIGRICCCSLLCSRVQSASSCADALSQFAQFLQFVHHVIEMISLGNLCSGLAACALFASALAALWVRPALPSPSERYVKQSEVATAAHHSVVEGVVNRCPSGWCSTRPQAGPAPALTREQAVLNQWIQV